MSSSSRNTTSSDMSTLTASLERSLQNFSLNHHHNHTTDFIGGYGSSSTSTDESSPGRIEHHLYSHRRGRRVHPCLSSSSSSSASSSTSKLSDTNTLLELNSHISMPYHWEQCLDLKTGEVYYINWRTGMKAKEDPRLSSTSPPSVYTANCSDDHYYSDEDESDSDEEVESEGSSTEYSSPTSHQNYRSSSAAGKTASLSKLTSGKKSGKSCSPEDVLVVAGCKSCMMYYMVPKHVDDCPKCTAHLLHFDDRSIDHSI